MECLKTIAHINTPFPEKFGVPFQSNVVGEVRSRILFEPEYRNLDALRGLEAFSHLWLIWGFSRANREGWSPTVRPPKLGGNKRVGVFASRSPFRPNGMGLSSVRLDSIDWNPACPVLHVLGADMVDGTPIYDIKPYLAFTDSHPDARGAYFTAGETLEVRVGDDMLQAIPPQGRQVLLALLAQDPRPSYQSDPARKYGMRFQSFDVRFTVEGRVLTVHQILENP